MEAPDVGGTLVWYFYICPRQVWLLGHQITPDKDNPFIEMGRAIDETSYRRDPSELNFGSAKVDRYRVTSDGLVIAEVKKSSRHLKSATMQLAHYLRLLKDRGVKAKGELRIPTEKKTVRVELTAELESELDGAVESIRHILRQEGPPPPTRGQYCRGCGYEEFCWS